MYIIIRRVIGTFDKNRVTINFDFNALDHDYARALGRGHDRAGDDDYVEFVGRKIGRQIIRHEIQRPWHYVRDHFN